MRGLMFGLAGGLAALLFAGQASAEHCGYGGGYSEYRSTTVRSYGGGYGYGPGAYAPGYNAGYGAPGYGAGIAGPGYAPGVAGYGGYAQPSYGQSPYGAAYPGGSFYRSTSYRSYSPTYCPYGY